MNCQDISRLADTGSISNLSEAQYDDAESHARHCRDCAAIWGCAVAAGPGACACDAAGSCDAFQDAGLPAGSVGARPFTAAADGDRQPRGSGGGGWRVDVAAGGIAYAAIGVVGGRSRTSGGCHSTAAT